MKRIVLGVVVATVAAMWSCGPTDKETNCSDGLDNDKNGAADCLDPACASSSACSGGDGGAGKACETQATCFQQNLFADRPLQQCIDHVCASQGKAIAVKFQARTSAFTGITMTFRSMATRFISKTAVDGSAVTCDTLKAIATGKTAADADQLDKTGKFNYLAIDVTPVPNLAPPSPVANPFLYTATGSNFIIWNELWTQSPNPDTHQPQGTRVGYGCFETGPEVAPIVATDDCPITDGGSPTCRTIDVTMPGPN